MSERDYELPEIVYRPTHTIFDGLHHHAPAVDVLRERYPDFFELMKRSRHSSFEANKSLEDLCRHFTIPYREFLNLMVGYEMPKEQEKCRLYATQLGFDPAALFPVDIYPWLYCDPRSIAPIPDHYIRYGGRVVPEFRHEIDQSADEATQEPETIGMSEKLQLSKQWTLLRAELRDAEKKHVRRSTSATQKVMQQARSAFEEVCFALAGQVALEYKPEYSSPEDAKLDAYVALLETQLKYDEQTGELVTFVRSGMVDALQAAHLEEKAAKRVSTRSLDSAFAETMHVTDDEDNQDQTETSDDDPEPPHPNDEVFLASNVEDGRLPVWEEVNVRVDPETTAGVIGRVLQSLTPREREIVKYRFALFGYEHKTLEQLGEMFDITSNRIRQIEVKALRKLRHPENAGQLEKFLP